MQFAVELDRDKALVEQRGDLTVTVVTDYREGADERPRYLAATPLVELSLGEAGRVLIRPSGTEPKLKIYVDLRGDAGEDWLGAEEELLEKAVAAAEDAATFLGL